MNIKHRSDEKRGIFFIQQDNNVQAEMTYVKSGERAIIIDHTEVGEELKGQGAGKEMVKAAVEFARENGIKIYATCPFAKKVLEMTDEYSDVRG